MATRVSDLRRRVDQAFGADGEPSGAGVGLSSEAGRVFGPPSNRDRDDDGFLSRAIGAVAERVGGAREGAGREAFAPTSRGAVLSGTPDTGRPARPRRDDLSGLDPSAAERARGNVQQTLDRGLSRVRSFVLEGAEPGSLESRATMAVSRAVPDVIEEPAEAIGETFAGGVLPPDAGGREVQERGIEAAVEQGIDPNIIAAADLAGLLTREGAIELVGMGTVRPALRGARLGRRLTDFAVRNPRGAAFLEGAARFGPEGALLGGLSQALEEGEINRNTALVAGIAGTLGGALGGTVKMGEVIKAFKSGDPGEVARVIPRDRLEEVVRRINQNAEVVDLPDGRKVFRFPDGEDVGVDETLAEIMTSDKFSPLTERFAFQTPEQAAARESVLPARVRPSEADVVASRVREGVGPTPEQVGPQAASEEVGRSSRAVTSERPAELPPGRGPGAEAPAPVEATNVKASRVSVGDNEFDVVRVGGRGGVMLNGEGKVVATLPDNAPPIFQANASRNLRNAVEVALDKENLSLRRTVGAAELGAPTEGQARATGAVGRQAHRAEQRGAVGSARPSDPALEAAEARVRARNVRIPDEGTADVIRDFLPPEKRQAFDNSLSQLRQMESRRISQTRGAAELGEPTEGGARAAGASSRLGATQADRPETLTREASALESMQDAVNDVAPKAEPSTPAGVMGRGLGEQLREAAERGYATTGDFLKGNFSRMEHIVPRVFGEDLGGQYVNHIRQVLDRALPRKGRNFEAVRAIARQRTLKSADRELVWDLVAEHGFEAESNAPSERIASAIADLRQVFDAGLEDYVALGGTREGGAAAATGRFLPQLPNKEGAALIRAAQERGFGSGRVRAAAEQMVIDNPDLTLDQALIRIKNYYQRGLSGDLGYYTQTRTPLPDQLVRKDYMDFGEDFFEREAMFIEGIREFGFDDEGARAIFAQMSEIDPGFTTLLQNTHKIHFGQGDPQAVADKAAWGFVSNLLTASKLSSPFTTIRQIFQRYVNTADLPLSVTTSTMIRDLPPVISRWFGTAAQVSERMGLEKAGQRLARKSEAIQSLAREARETGGVQARATATQDVSEGAPLEGFTGLLLRATGFLPGEEGNQIATAIAAKRGLQLTTERFLATEAGQASRPGQLFRAFREGVMPIVTREAGEEVPLIGGRKVVPSLDPEGAVQAARGRTIERVAGGAGRAQRVTESVRAFQDVGEDLTGLEPGQVTRRVLDRVQALTDDVDQQKRLIEAWRNGDPLDPADASAVAIVANRDRNFALDLLSKPVKWDQNGAFRTIFKFKPFMAKQFEFMRKHVFQEAVKGNLAPAMKTAMWGMIAAETYNLARDVFRDRSESITLKLTEDPTQLDSLEEWAYLATQHMADAAIVGVLPDLVWGWDNFVLGPLYSQGKQLSNFAVNVVQAKGSPRQWQAATGKLFQRSAPGLQLLEDARQQLGQVFSEDNYFPEYNRMRHRVRDWAEGRDSEGIEQAGFIERNVIDIATGREGFVPGKRTLRSSYAWDNVASGDLEAAVEYLGSIYRDADGDPEKLSTIEKSLEQSMRAAAPLGALTRARDWAGAENVVNFRRDIGEEAFRDIASLQRQFVQEATSAINKARRESRR